MPKHLVLISILFFSVINIAKSQDNDIFTRIEIAPEYKGGPVAMKKFISEHLIYPKKALKHKKEGKVIVEIRIDKEGNITEPKIVKGEDLGYGLPEEALRIVSLMPEWNPAIIEQKPEPRRRVAAYVAVTIDFELDDYNKDKK
ncbi:energy transducer TonB [Chitinophaga ginsengisoli]|uniref:Protein TonB n=1 Tax=Chitinophaga ginsengisoli TaxID=363837 RepID=A0A2P8GDK1_9BACT|nr:energy transducer TonB [Chitinophaga ginsengisoli]PSL32041.1 protein TonB [Chitinophaga ginsengisoli]